MFCGCFKITSCSYHFNKCMHLFSKNKCTHVHSDSVSHSDTLVNSWSKQVTTSTSIYCWWFLWEEHDRTDPCTVDSKSPRWMLRGRRASYQFECQWVTDSVVEQDNITSPLQRSVKERRRPISCFNKNVQFLIDKGVNTSIHSYNNIEDICDDSNTCCVTAICG